MYDTQCDSMLFLYVINFQALSMNKSENKGYDKWGRLTEASASEMGGSGRWAGWESVSGVETFAVVRLVLIRSATVPAFATSVEMTR